MRAVSYSRVSTDEQAEEGFSLDAQYEKNVQYINDENWSLVGVYVDPGKSGKDLNRKDIQRMLTDLKDGKFDAIVVHKLDRLTRNIGDLHYLLQLFDKHQIKFVSIAERLDTSTAMGRMFIYMLGIFAQWFRENLSEEVTKGMTKRAELGLRNASTPPYGYKLIQGTNSLEIDENEAQWVKKIYEWYLEQGYGFRRICGELNERGITTNTGGRWHTNGIRYLLANPTYTGKNHWKPKKTDKIIIREADHPAIIEEEIFIAAQIQIKRRGEGDMVRSSYDRYPFSGILKCAICGRSFYGAYSVRNKKRYSSYRCEGYFKYHDCAAGQISETKLVDLFFKYIHIQNKEQFTDDQPVKNEINKERKRIEREIANCEKRKKNLMKALGDSRLPYEDIVKAMQKETNAYERLTAELESLPPDEDEIKVTHEQVMELLMSLQGNWSKMEATTKKSLIQSMFRKIVIQKEGGEWKIRQMEPYIK